MRRQDDRVQIPIIDISPFESGLGSALSEVVEQISRACEEIGFFVIVGHGIPKDLIGHLKASARTFFDLPDKTKMDVGRTGDSMGGLMYFPFRAESLGAAAGEDAPEDLKETLDFGLRFLGDAWPLDPPDLQDACLAYNAALGRLAGRLRKIFMAALGLPEDYLEGRFGTDLSSLRILNYPEPTDLPAPGQLRAGVHADYGVLTILYTEDSPGGLQVQAKDGTWMDVVSVADAFVVNIGDAMMRWTNNRWVSTLHRVINPPPDSQGSTRRQSIAYFSNPDADAMIECLPGFSDSENPARYEPITYREYAQERYRQAHGEDATLS